MKRHFFAYLPRFLVVVHDLCMVVLVWVGLRWLASSAGAPAAPSLIREVVLALVLQGAALQMVGLYRGVWRFASLPDLANIVRGVVIGLVAIVAVTLLANWLPAIPRRVLVPYPLALIFLLGAPRLLYRMWKDKSTSAARQSDARRILILGAGRAAENLLRDLRSDPRYHPVGLLDDTLGMAGAKLQGVPVLGTLDELRTIARETSVDLLVIAIPSASADQMQRVVSLCDETGLPFRTVPRLSDMLDGPRRLQFNEVAIEDLLGRDPVAFDWQKVSRALGGKRLLITGAGGSIGSELVRQCARAGAEQIVLFERHELSLHALLAELRRDFPEINVTPVLADCGDPTACRLALRHGVDIVFHAAAFKHVPMLEDQLREALRNNVLASVTLMRACSEAKVPGFVLISTDKAIAPANILGATKRFAELACQLEAARGSTRLTVIRFGNVLDSAGSVVPLFRQQIAAGGPVTVTDPEVTRFFMTIPEACQLILQTSFLESSRLAVYALDMGRPVAIRELAQQMIRLAGKRPDRDIEIRYTGLRPGEKLHEMLFHPDERYQPTRHPRILHAQPRPLDVVKIQGAVDRLRAMLNEGASDPELLPLLREVVAESQPSAEWHAAMEQAAADADLPASRDLSSRA
jgi:FlaA1/EpsC-like NDP-sugar epimerase